MNQLIQTGALLAWMIVCSSAQAQIAPAERPSSKASATVQKLLDNASRLVEAKESADSLNAAEQALEAARKERDRPGEALSQEARAKALQGLTRTAEAQAAWQSAARIWADVADAPGQVTALAQAGLLCGVDNESEGNKLFAQGLTIAKADTQRPDAVSHALFESGNALAMGHYQSGQQTTARFAGSYARLVKSPHMQQAWDYLTAALAIQEKRAPGSPALAETLTALARVADEFAYATNGPDADKYVSFEKEYSARAVDIAQRLAPDSSLLADSLQWLGNAKAIDDPPAGWAEAPQHFLAALRIRRAIAPAGSMEEASILDDLARVENKQTRTAKALEYIEQAVALGERLGPDSQEFAFSLEEMGTINEDLGDLRAGRANLEHALRIEEKNHAFLGPVYVNLGSVAFYQSDYTAAREYFEKAVAMFQTTARGKFGAAAALENLGGVYFQLGDLTSALEYHKRALPVMEELAPSSVYTALAFDEIGNDLKQQGNYTEAGDYYQKALATQEQLVPDSFYVVTTLGNMAALARAQKNTALAVDYDRRALETGKKACPDSWCVVGVINELGELAYEQGDLANSESNFRRAVEMREKNLGPNHPDLARSLSGLALTLAAEGKTTEAMANALRAERIGADHLRLTMRVLSERQGLAFEESRASGLQVALTLASDSAATSFDRSQVFDALIHSRALVFDELAARHRSAYGSGSPEVMQAAERLFSTRARLATLVLRGAGDSLTDTYRKMLDDARTQKESAERQLAEKSAAFRQDQLRSLLGLKDVAAAMPEKSALVAFVRYSRSALERRQSKAPPLPAPYYGVFVLRAGRTEPEFVPLAPASVIEKQVASWRRGIAQQSEAAPLSYRGNSTDRQTGTALRRSIWDPIAPKLAGVERVFVVPDAALHLVNFAALPVGSSRYLLETGPVIHYISAERDLVPAESQRGVGILVVGNPAFDKAGTRVLASNAPTTPADAPVLGGALVRGLRSACGTFKTLRFTPLPASQLEADRISALWRASASSRTQPSNAEPLQITGADASPEAFRRYAPGKRVLHVATHGFFLEGQCDSATQAGPDNKRDDKFLPATAENPLLLSGLAFSGANRRRSEKTDEGDGVLTAEEIAGLNLEGVDWAVLSACDTGVGEIKVGEGVFGLRRAFQVAGAKTVIMSLWPVEDQSAKQWMENLYQEHFLNGKSTAEAVRDASLRILRQRRARHRSTDPLYWGAFIAAGDWH